ncbi:hypothetical protein, unlikely [Trypanosoma brucei gambiense DAL972]|uniref:Uncharacterized protein n=1 Tax=Trypanosoma brucei gambiense (strain MHOM/CI/86/DAL972) TaxID=679716 RepID=D0A119_TRYB9|nr:hypothetical protein, unlikely [Trypanosoma brucei gambiense DAL972]CBH14961.1 hypothetical protein, unlikely [Trypanosoma brucei gambiense DAL972]|eukprot:XP_011777227.1 hypothetical protein, unlikely [Trypanosoma brucei gambiense DAL972]
MYIFHFLFTSVVVLSLFYSSLFSFFQRGMRGCPFLYSVIFRLPPHDGEDCFFPLFFIYLTSLPSAKTALGNDYLEYRTSHIRRSCEPPTVRLRVLFSLSFFSQSRFKEIKIPLFAVFCLLGWWYCTF